MATDWLAVNWLVMLVRSLLVTGTTIPSAGFEASAFVVTFFPGSTRNPDGTVTPGPTCAKADTIDPGSMLAWSISAPGPISVGLAAEP